MSWGSSGVEHHNGFVEDAGSSPRPQHHIICGHQPVYLPGIIVMNKLALADAVVFVGHCKYESGSWHSRNYIRGDSSRQLLSVPVIKGLSINETKPLPTRYWRDQHLRTIEFNYKDRPFFKEYFPEIEAAIHMRWESLSDLNIGLINILMHMLGIGTKTYRSEELDFQNYQPDDRQPRKTKMLAALCGRLGARHYLSSPGEIDYIKPEYMNGFGHHYQQFTHPVYRQSRANTYFVPNLSVIDLLFNVGPEAARIVRESGHI